MYLKEVRRIGITTQRENYPVQKIFEWVTNRRKRTTDKKNNTY